jgi:glycosyltransferase involved in cell wall biosynthesis
MKLPSCLEPGPHVSSSVHTDSGMARNGQVRLTYCHLLIPVFNEEAGIQRVLDSAFAAELPPGARWATWRVADDASTDETVLKVRHWHARHTEVPLEIVRSTDRKGKPAALATYHQLRLNARSSDGDLVIVADGDIDVGPKAFAELVEAFASTEGLAIASGVSIPMGDRHGRRASRFQARVAELHAQRGLDRPKMVDGRFFAYRVERLGEFNWVEGRIHDDLQLSHYAFEHKLEVRRLSSARVGVVPPQGVRDFYLQTHRSISALHLAPTAFQRPFKEGRLSALVAATKADPLGAVAYLTLRSVAFGIRVISANRFVDTWEQSRSSKMKEW